MNHHDSTVTVSDIRFAVWLASLTPAEVAVDRAVNMQPAEIALMALPNGHRA